MGSKLSNPLGKDLYEFWGNKIADMLLNELESIEITYNLARTSILNQ